MDEIRYVDRKSGRIEKEMVYGGSAVRWAYGVGLFPAFIRLFVAKVALLSWGYGFWQRLSFTRRKVAPFIKKYHVDPSEFAKKVEEFTSFDDFFVRHLKEEARPIAEGAKIATIPADARYWFYQDISKVDGFIVKDKKFSLAMLIQNEQLSKEYEGGSMAIARLCPVDYHRFHFPCAGVVSLAKPINGSLYSVNPLALRWNVGIFTENKRALTEIATEDFGKVLYLEIGATFVGSIHQTYKPGAIRRGDEKGFFSFGGSALILLFKPGTIQFEEDLLRATSEGLEMRCLMGQIMGRTGV